VAQCVRYITNMRLAAKIWRIARAIAQCNAAKKPWAEGKKRSPLRAPPLHSRERIVANDQMVTSSEWA
jgi:hypothetical protein